MQELLSIIMIIGIGTGVGVFVLGIYIVIEAIINHFSWIEVKLSEKEIKDMIIASKKQYPTKGVVAKITERRGFGWSSFSFDRNTGKLKIRIGK